MPSSTEQQKQQFLEAVNLIETCLQINEFSFPVCLAALSFTCAKMCQESGIPRDLFEQFWNELLKKSVDGWDEDPERVSE